MGKDKIGGLDGRMYDFGELNIEGGEAHSGCYQAS